MNDCAQLDKIFTLHHAVLEDRSVFTSTLGWSAEETKPDFIVEVPVESSMCPHMMTRTEDDHAWVMGDAREDWRFENNPLVKNTGGFSFFASSNIFLPTSFPGPLEGEVVTAPRPKKLPVGALCLADPIPRHDFSEEDEIFLNRLAGIISRESRS